MPTDTSSAPVTTTRRRFLLSTAAGGAMATTAALGVGTGPGVPAAGAQGSTGLDDAAFVTFAAPLELAAVLAYQAGLDSGRLSSTWTTNALELQGHHQEVVDALSELLPTTASPPVAANAFSDPIVESIASASDQDAVLEVLGQMEDVLSATHLRSLESINDPITARVIAQVLAAEAQAATALARGAGADVKAVTPDVADTTGALAPGDIAGAPPPDSSEAGNGSDTSGSGGEGSGGADTSGGSDASSGGAGTSGGSAETGGGDDSGDPSASGGGDSSGSETGSGGT